MSAGLSQVKRAIERGALQLYVQFVPSSRAADPPLDPRLPPARLRRLHCHHEVVHHFARHCPGMMAVSAG